MRTVGAWLVVVGVLVVASARADDALDAALAAYRNQDFGEAARLLRPLAEQGNADAQLKLGILYQFGRGVEQNYPEAMKWYRAADMLGNSQARDRIARLQGLMDEKSKREAEIANQPKPQSDWGAGVVNFTGAVVAGLAHADPAATKTTLTEINSTGSNIKYSGPYSREVAYLLSHSPSTWRTPTCKTCNDGVAPTVPAKLPCVRDTYYYAALTAAWAAESHANVGDNAAATDNAKTMRENLTNANKLCSNAPAVGSVRCPTLSYWGCPGW